MQVMMEMVAIFWKDTNGYSWFVIELVKPNEVNNTIFCLCNKYDYIHLQVSEFSSHVDWHRYDQY